MLIRVEVSALRAAPLCSCSKPLFVFSGWQRRSSHAVQLAPRAAFLASKFFLETLGAIASQSLRMLLAVLRESTFPGGMLQAHELVGDYTLVVGWNRVWAKLRCSVLLNTEGDSSSTPKWNT